MKKRETGVFITLAFFGLLFLMPFSGNGADLTVSDVITGNGNMTLNGGMSATSFSGSGSGLTGLDPTNLSSGTANINVSGNAGSVTNGLYSSGSYADPSWITSLSPGKLTSGTANINISGNAATATTANSVADSAVTPVKIAFYGNVAVVAPSGGDYTDPATAMVNYTTWCPGSRTEANACLLKIMPGVYDIGTSTVVMQPYIDIEGSGQNVTVITGTVSNGSWPPSNGVVNGASTAEIRFLTVKNTALGNFGAAILNSSASPAITNVTATASGATISYGFFNTGSSSPTMTHVTATASGGTESYGVLNTSSSPTMTHVTATASGGTYNIGVDNDSSSPMMTNVTATGSGGTSSYGVSNTGSSSPTMTNVMAAGKDGDLNYGVYNSSSSPTMTHVTAIASGGTDSNYGVHNSNSSSPTMTHVTAIASGGTDSSNYGVYNTSSSSPIMTNVTATGSGGTGNYGLSVATGTVLIDRSTFDGSTNSIYNDGTVKMGGSKLASAAKGGSGTYNCVLVYKYIGGTLSSAGTSCE